MKVKSKIVARYEDKGRLKAVATVCLDGKFLVTGVRVADCQKGLAVFMPSREIHAGEYRDICFPITSELYKQIKDSVLEAYARPEDDEPAYGDCLEAEKETVQTGETVQADAVMTAETGILPEDDGLAGNPESGEQPENTAQSEQQSQ